MKGADGLTLALLVVGAVGVGITVYQAVKGAKSTAAPATGTSSTTPATGTSSTTPTTGLTPLTGVGTPSTSTTAPAVSPVLTPSQAVAQPKVPEQATPSVALPDPTIVASGSNIFWQLQGGDIIKRIELIRDMQARGGGFHTLPYEPAVPVVAL